MCLPNIPAGGIIFQVKVVKSNLQCRITWNRNRVITIHIVWIKVWISRACQNIIYNWITFPSAWEIKYFIVYYVKWAVEHTIVYFRSLFVGWFVLELSNLWLFIVFQRTTEIIIIIFIAELQRLERPSERSSLSIEIGKSGKSCIWPLMVVMASGTVPNRNLLKTLADKKGKPVGYTKHKEVQFGTTGDKSIHLVVGRSGIWTHAAPYDREPQGFQFCRYVLPSSF